MKAPSYQELLSVQSSVENDMIRKEYPEWYSLLPEQRVTRDGVTFEQLQAMAKFSGVEVAALLVLSAGIIVTLTALI